MDTFSIERNKRGIANVWYLAASLAARVATIGENKKKTHAQKHAQEQITSHHLKGVKRSHERDKKRGTPYKVFSRCAESRCKTFRVICHLCKLVVVHFADLCVRHV